MAIDSAGVVKELRERTGAGIMDCKTALQAVGGDLEKAVDYLRKKGAASAVKRAGREAREGLVAVRVHGSKAAIVEINCETDFVARTEDFRSLAALLLEETFEKGEKAVESPRVADRVSELSGKIGEKILARRSRLLSSDGVFFTYVHANNKIGVILDLAGTKAGADADIAELGKNLAMQVAAQNPLCVRRSEVPAAVIEREKAVYAEEAKGKPQNILEKILQGKLDKFYQTNCLLEQAFIKDDKQSVGALVSQVEKKSGEKIQVKGFVRFQIGESVPT